MVAEVGGGVVVERAPRAVRERIDPWGPVPAPALAVMRAIKREFDPRGVLNPGRFVGGL
jgi:glycolate oxidase FAD binding subunit